MKARESKREEVWKPWFTPANTLIPQRHRGIKITGVDSSKAPKTRSSKSSQTNVILQTMQRQAQQTNSILTASNAVNNSSTIPRL